MPFYKEPKGYTKTALSDLQGAWENLREVVVESTPFPEWEKLLLHIDEAMSWESVRNLEQMRKTLLLIRNIAAQAEVPGEVWEGISTVGENLDEVFRAIVEGEVK